jgi:predicted nucleic acid-binding protein
MRKPRLYIETSTWNFYFADDAPEKMDITKNFFRAVEKGSYQIFISETVLREIANASEPKRRMLFDLISKYSPEELEISEDAVELVEAYLQHNVVPDKKRDDAFHVAAATVHEIDAIVTWNFKHLANLRKEELFNAVNLERGYIRGIKILTPMEVVTYED